MPITSQTPQSVSIVPQDLSRKHIAPGQPCSVVRGRAAPGVPPEPGGWSTSEVKQVGRIYSRLCV